ncbi:CopD family protein [Thiohalomonas denitrificans]|uniref:Protoporphyrinogen IX oxidase n=1 Tax=Thiohalomonas denitrificans TaxID=415747 RepID=A0A1G5QEK9_9GAMM|nr:CopD family protein [Thiohalomonas denitrificans]SCZ60325.1 putative membrane protein [Thiohalomonas denitrificans]
MALFLKLLHIGFVMFWIAGALYVPRLFRLYNQAQSAAEAEQAIGLARRLYFELMTPSAIIAVLLGSSLVFFGFEGGWLPVKLSVVFLLVLYHLYCGRILLKEEKKQKSHGLSYFSGLSLIPIPLFLAIVVLAVAKPF